MIGSNQHQAPGNVASAKFAQGLHALRGQCRSFSACVRLEYPNIEQAIDEGIALELIVRLLCESYGVQGSLSALKSALSRIRRATEGRACQEWLDSNAPLPQERAFGVPGGVNPYMPSMQGNPSGAAYVGNVPQHAPGAQQRFSASGQLHMPNSTFQYNPSPSDILNFGSYRPNM
jgi:hypothetical protein